MVKLHVRDLEGSLSVETLSSMNDRWYGRVLDNMRACEGKMGAWVILIYACIIMEMVGSMAHVAIPSSTITAPKLVLVQQQMLAT